MADWKMIKPKKVECANCGKKVREGYWTLFSGHYYPICPVCHRKRK